MQSTDKEEVEGEETEDSRPPRIIANTPLEVQRLKVEKLMMNPAKPVYIPAPRKDKAKKLPEPPEFVRNVMGSSAGAGSGEFHIYRHIRRREYARVKLMEEEAEKETAEEEFRRKIEERDRALEEKAAKKREKRKKKKELLKKAKRKKKGGGGQESDTRELRKGEVAVAFVVAHQRYGLHQDRAAQRRLL
ncbi:unnamed protein product [Cyprideis torosa]|uniref:Uncharacterized protein n=1 Tax=Cyprideis torosa TaxID=163714 RepID=A0A7R8WDU9_9CRUS|nr:unnamed protein product [Cyprideis torosa]CAG0889516.1 unnamed protein product [Cyprideis torosa]